MQDSPKSPFYRSVKLARAGLRVGSNYALHHLQNGLTGKKETDRKKLHQKNAQYLFNEFTQLRGTALKLAQTLSMDQGLLPEEFVEIMSTAQYRVPPLGRPMVRSIIRKELGKEPEKIFRSFSADAFAAASIGQVHEAVLHNGRHVMVKVQYPDVRAGIHADLRMARLIFLPIAGSSMTDRYFSEIKNKMMEETDYEQEGASLRLFHKRYHGDCYAIPEFIPEFSTQRILTMSCLEGEHLHTFLQRNPSRKEMNHFGQRLWDFFHSQINNSRTLHADTHPGNFLFCKDGRLGVLDFGCIKTCPVDFFLDYLSLLPTHLKGDVEEIRDLYQRLELMEDSSKTDEAASRNSLADKADSRNSFFDLCKHFGDLVVEAYKHPQFDFGDPEFIRTYRSLMMEAARRSKPRGSHHFIYVTRAHVGLYHMLMQLGAKIDTSRAREETLALHSDLIKRAG